MKIKTCMAGFLFLVCSLFLCACKQEKPQENAQEEGVYAVYYKNQSGTKLMTENYRAAGTDETTLVRELLGKMRDHPDDINLLSVFPENLSLSKYEREGAFLTLYFDSLYTEMDPVSEILLRAAVVKTMCQIPGVNYVSFFVNDQPLMDANGAPAGIMQPDTFMENLNENLESMQPVTLILYFTNETGDLLYETERTVLYNSDMPLEKLVVSQLIQGPSSEGVYPTLPETLTLLGVTVKDGVCYVDFDSSFISGALDVKDYIPIYSLVNSLSELTNVSKVQITINGSTDVKFRENISFSTIFERNLDYVGGMEE
ncbi:MAG: GerMN domain-containing protein [Lachnospiraceae bacterium]|nr:GerMN domain-containing protein [Lachnospiraceae bacterium]